MLTLSFWSIVFPLITQNLNPESLRTSFKPTSYGVKQAFLNLFSRVIGSFSCTHFLNMYLLSFKLILRQWEYRKHWCHPSSQLWQGSFRAWALLFESRHLKKLSNLTSLKWFDFFPYRNVSQSSAPCNFLRNQDSIKTNTATSSVPPEL